MRMRKGGFLVDALLAIAFLAMAIIPLAASLTYAYSALLSSVEKRARLDEIYSETERDIVNFTMGGDNSDNFLNSFTESTSPAVTFRGGYDPVGITPPCLCYKEEPFDVSWRHTSSVLRVYVLR